MLVVSARDEADPSALETDPAFSQPVPFGTCRLEHLGEHPISGAVPAQYLVHLRERLLDLRTPRVMRGQQGVRSGEQVLGCGHVEPGVGAQSRFGQPLARPDSELARVLLDDAELTPLLVRLLQVVANNRVVIRRALPPER